VFVPGGGKTRGNVILVLEARKSKHVEFRLEHIAGVFIVGSFGLGSALLLFLMKKVFVLIKRDNAVPGLR